MYPYSPFVLSIAQTELLDQWAKEQNKSSEPGKLLVMYSTQASGEQYVSLSCDSVPLLAAPLAAPIAATLADLALRQSLTTRRHAA
mmetsp:Transcript_35658/g.114081  ORF Transcript_35658/g.114081 Transcript_35658/m.114081 type:complete len:86 (+) Transcript_35658:2568-2825(+)